MLRRRGRTSVQAAENHEEAGKLSRVRAESLLPYYPPPEYRGQLDDGYQALQKQRRANANLEDFVWYHATDLPDGTTLPGAWDLRGTEAQYLGGVDLAGKRVLELGPATGHLSFYMESQGAEVVAFEAGFDVSVDTLPYHGHEDPLEKEIVMTGTIDRNHDAWWHLHTLKNSKAKFVQGNIYAMPPDLGAFDVSFFGAILLHLREPWGALRQAALRTTEMMVVTEPLQDDEMPPETNLMRFSPSADNHLTNWWSIYPGAVLSMLRRLGFGDTTITYHTQQQYLGHDLSKDAVGQKMYTIVGRRTKPEQL